MTPSEETRLREEVAEARREEHEAQELAEGRLGSLRLWMDEARSQNTRATAAESALESVRGDLRLAAADYASGREITAAQALALAEARGALRAAREPLAIAASYVDQPDIAVGLRIHSKDCAKQLAVVDAALARAGEQEMPSAGEPASSGQEVVEAMRAADGRFHYHDVVAALRAQRVAALGAAALEYADPKLESIKVYCRHVAQRLRELAEQAKREGT